MTLADGEKAIARVLDTALDGGGGSRALRMRGSGREDTGLAITISSACQKIYIYLNPKNKWRFRIAKNGTGHPALHPLAVAVAPVCPARPAGTRSMPGLGPPMTCKEKTRDFGRSPKNFHVR